MKIFGFDPGETNSAYAVVDMKPGVAYRLREIGQIDNTIKNLTDKLQKPKVRHKKKLDKNGKKKPTKWKEQLPPLQEQLPKYYKTISGLFRDHGKPKEVYAERFQTRGVKSKSVETVSMMNGVVATMCMHRHTNFYAVIAGTWKNHVNRHFSLDALYVAAKKLGFTPHEVDALLIAVTRGGKVPPPPMKAILKLLTLYLKRH